MIHKGFSFTSRWYWNQEIISLRVHDLLKLHTSIATWCSANSFSICWASVRDWGMVNDAWSIASPLRIQQSTWAASVCSWHNWTHCSNFTRRISARSSRSISRSCRNSSKTWTRVCAEYWLSAIREMLLLSNIYNRKTNIKHVGKKNFQATRSLFWKVYRIV